MNPSLDVRVKRLTVSHPSAVSIKTLLENPLNCEVNIQPTHLQSIFESPVVRILKISAQLVSPSWDRRFSRDPLVLTLSSPPWNPPSFSRSSTPASAEPRHWVNPGAHWLSSGIGGHTIPVQGALLANEREIAFFNAPPPSEGEMEWAYAMTMSKAVPDRVLDLTMPELKDDRSMFYWAESMHRLWPKLNRNVRSPLSSASPPSSESFGRLVQECVDQHMGASRWFLNLQAPLKVRFVWPKAEWEAMELAARTRPSMGGPTGVVTLVFEYLGD